MTPKQKAFRKELIKQIHIAPKYTAYFKENEEDYRDKLEEHFGKRSAKDLTIEQLVALRKWLNHDLPELPVTKDRSKDATKRQMTAIFGLWERYARDKSEKALRAFVTRITGNTYLHLEKMRKSDAQKVILALKNSLKELKQ